MNQPLSLHPPAYPIRRRLWLGGMGVVLFLTTVVVASAFAGPGASLVGGSWGDDLIPSYMAGAFVREGRPDKLMDFAEAERFQDALRCAAGLERHGRTGPWLNPPFYAWVFAPLAALPYPAALRVWTGLNLLLFGGALVLLCRMVPGGWRRWGLVPLLVCPSMPFLQALASQQNTFLSLAILAAAVTLWRARLGLAAGMVAGLLLFKPQLAAAVAVAMACTLGGRAVLGWAVTGLSLLLVTVVTLPGAIDDYLLKLPALLPWLQAGKVYPWERQVTFQGFWRLLLQGSVSGPAPLAARLLWPLCAAAVAAPLGLLLWRTVRSPARMAPDRVIVAAVGCMPLVVPYYMDYDLLLLAVPAVLFAADVCRAGRPLGRLERWITGGWAVLFFWLFLNAAVGYETRVSLTVPLLAGLGGLLVARAWPARAIRAVARTEVPGLRIAA